MKIVLLRGLAREAGHWLDFPGFLLARIREQLPQQKFSLVTPDFLGCGEFYQKPAAKTVGQMTDHVRQLVQPRHQATEKVIVIGLSMGGMVALDWAIRYPDEFAGIVLINSSLGNQPLFWRLQRSAWLTALGGLLSPVMVREKYVLAKVSNDRENFSRNLAHWCDIQLERPISLVTIARMLLAAKKFHVEQFPKQIDGLLLASELDRLVSIKCSEDLAKKTEWPLKLHSTAGHDLPLDDPQWVSWEVVSWLQQVSL